MWVELKNRTGQQENGRIEGLTRIDAQDEQRPTNTPNESTKRLEDTKGKFFPAMYPMYQLQLDIWLRQEDRIG